MMGHFPFDNTYTQLPDTFYARVNPTPVSAPKLIKINEKLARQLGIDPDALSSSAGVEVLAGKRIPDGAEPIAAAYAGHQFGQFTPQLGDGRAILLGEVVDRDGHRCDLQLKGSGPTPFSRRGDGRAALGPVLREYIVSEAMAALGIPTTRALAAVTTGDHVIRETKLPGAVLTRVASSHIRVGTFEFFASRGDFDAVRRLADYAIARHYPGVAQSSNPYRAFLDGVIARQAELIARWLLVGFIHGVMNTDNMSVAGETIDYGPCAFMDAYDPETVFSSIDYYGRYAYSRQPSIAHWNLASLAECLVPLLASNADEGLSQAQEAVAAFADQFNSAYIGGLRQKLGLSTARNGDGKLAQELLARMAASKADFTLTFRRLCDAAASANADPAVSTLFDNPAAFEEWAVGWRQRLAQEPQDVLARQADMRRVNPAVIPRNHFVEAAIEAAVIRQDFSLFHELNAVLSAPYDNRADFARYADRPPSDHGVYQTFCGT
jgi:serine/tyrosine/threonine adenylyltransferase